MSAKAGARCHFAGCGSVGKNRLNQHPYSFGHNPDRDKGSGNSSCIVVNACNNTSLFTLLVKRSLRMAADASPENGPQFKPAMLAAGALIVR